MKKIKLLTTILLSTAFVPTITGITSCSTSKHMILLYADNGQFEGRKNFICISCGDNKKLSSATDYEIPESLDDDLEFAGWTDENGQYISEDTIVTSDMVLKANYDEFAKKPQSFEKDSWPTVIDTINKGYVAFANAYCEYEGSKEDEAKDAIRNWLQPGENLSFPMRPVELSWENIKLTAYVHPIDIAYDTISGTNEKAKFTFEFVDIIDVCIYNNDKEFKFWYSPADGETPEKQAFLRKYLNETVFNYLPMSLRSAIKTVDKISPDFTFTYWGGNITIKDIQLTCKSSEKLFPLSFIENASVNQYDLPDEIEPWGDAYGFYQYFIQEGDLESLAKSHVKPLLGTWDAPSLEEKACIDYWLRTNLLTYEGEDLPEIEIELANAMAMYVDSPINAEYAFPCPGSAYDVGVGVSPAFCI